MAGADAANIQTASASYSNSVSQLVIRVHSRSSDANIRAQCLDLIDRMTAVGVYGLGADKCGTKNLLYVADHWLFVTAVAPKKKPADGQ